MIVLADASPLLGMELEDEGVREAGDAEGSRGRPDMDSRVNWLDDAKPCAKPSGSCGAGDRLDVLELGVGTSSACW